MIVTTGAFIASSLGLIPSFETNEREREEKDAKEAVAAGSPVTISAGGSYYGPGWWASAENHGARYNNTAFDWESFDPNRLTWAWLEKNWTPLNSTGVGINVLSEHEKTTLVQGVQISKLKCSEPLSGTILQNPGIGDGGEGVVPVDMALNVEAARPVTRELDKNGQPGEPLKTQIALDQGDQREFVVQFFTRTKSCTFQAHLVVSSEGKKYLVRIPATWKSGGKPDSYTFRATAPSPGHAYKTAYVPTGNLMEQVAPESIEWTRQNTPVHSGS
ncbi:hypothetical protein [Streptomyces venetus]|uniref:hypothetical protein n=1 Tax=Streptomyces venetus TaxID=1701086 RepID=UPI0031ED9FF6